MRTALFLAVAFLAIALHAQEPPKFRTDADGPVGTPAKKGKNAPKMPDWFKLVDTQFPPEGSAHAISGELIHVDHLERRFHLRVDRNDSQERGNWDLPNDCVMLPYGSIMYHGSPAALQDIPLGTHLHGLFYQREAGDKTPPPASAANRKTAEFEFRRCLRIEDDFSFHARQKQAWKVDSVDPGTKKLFATLQRDGAAVGKSLAFDLLPGTRVWKANAVVPLDTIEKGQTVLFNLTWATLYGPGRVAELWLDEPARTLATTHQLEKHRTYAHEHGLAGRIDAVDDEAQILTITFFGGVDPKLFDDLTANGADRVSVAVARESLMTYDPVNDRKGAAILEEKKVPLQPGSAGVQIRVKCDMLLEGFRPKHIVRVYPTSWKVIALPGEEQYFGRE